MNVKICYVFFFIFFCDLHAKDIYLDIEAELPNKSSISISYQDNINYFLPEELVSGVSREHVFDIIFFSNVKEAVELVIESKDIYKGSFCFVDEMSQKRLPFKLFCTDDKKFIKNEAVIYFEENLKEPVSRVISVGMKIPKVHSKNVLGGKLCTHFTVILQHIG